MRRAVPPAAPLRIGTFAPAAGLSNTAIFLWEGLLTAGLGLVVYGAAVARSAFTGSAPVGIAAVVGAAVMSGEQGGGELVACLCFFIAVAAHRSPCITAAVLHNTVTTATAGPYTGCVINPARALGPAIVFGLSTSTVLLYVAAQMAGGALAALLAGGIHGE